MTERCEVCGVTNKEHTRQHGVGLHWHRPKRDGEYTADNKQMLCGTCHSKRTRFRRKGRRLAKAITAKAPASYVLAVEMMAMKEDVTREEIVRRAVAAYAAEKLLQENPIPS